MQDVVRDALACERKRLADALSDSRSSLYGKLNEELIVSEWPNVERILLSLLLKTTTQSIIDGKLSSYPRKNRTKRALWVFDHIIKSNYLIDYIHPALAGPRDLLRSVRKLTESSKVRKPKTLQISKAIAKEAVKESSLRGHLNP